MPPLGRGIRLYMAVVSRSGTLSLEITQPILKVSAVIVLRLKQATHFSYRLILLTHLILILARGVPEGRTPWEAAGSASAWGVATPGSYFLFGKLRQNLRSRLCRTVFGDMLCHFILCWASLFAFARCGDVHMPWTLYPWYPASAVPLVTSDRRPFFTESAAAFYG